MSEVQESAPRAVEREVRAEVWVATTYFGEGYPYSIVNNLAELVFASLGASLGAVGLTSLFHLPWNLKFLWAPLVDHHETKRRWLVAVEIGLTLALVAAALATSGSMPLSVLAAAFLALAVLSATHDVAIDGFYLEALDEGRQSRLVGLRQLAYKAANLLVRGPAVVVAGLVGWRLGLLALAALMGALAAAHAVLLPRRETPKRPWREIASVVARPRLLGAVALLGGLGALARGLDLGARLRALGLGRVPVEAAIPVGLLALLLVLAVRTRNGAAAADSSRPPSQASPFRAAFAGFLSQPRAYLILAFVLSFRLGESFLQKMKWPFLREQAKVTLEQYGVVNGTFGVAASFAGTIVGGYLISRHGLRRWVWPFVLAQNGLHLLYVVLARWAAAGPVSLGVVTTFLCVEHVGEGLGTAVFTVYLMRCCDPAHRASHMAIVTALMSVGFTVAGMASGFLAEAVGYPRYFALTFLVTLPSMALIFVIPHLDGRGVTRAGAR